MNVSPGVGVDLIEKLKNKLVTSELQAGDVSDLNVELRNSSEAAAEADSEH